MYYNADYNVLYNVYIAAVAAQVLPRDCPLAANDGRPCSCGNILFIGYNWNEPYPSRWDKARAPILCIYVCVCVCARALACCLERALPLPLGQGASSNLVHLCVCVRACAHACVCVGSNLLYFCARARALA